MFSKLKIFSLMIILSAFTGCTEEAPVVPEMDQTIIWQGFYHDWTYNHRVNRMGDWVHDLKQTASGLKATLNHSAASGIGADNCSFTSFMSVLQLPASVPTATGEAGFVLRGAEGTITDTSVVLTILLPATNIDEAAVLLHGFDTYARPKPSPGLLGDGAADKIFHLEIRLEELSLRRAGDATAVDFTLSAALGADCRSPECTSGPIVDHFDYQLTVYYQAIGGPDEQFRTATSASSNAYSWEAPNEGQSNEIEREALKLTDQSIDGATNFAQAVTGISAWSFTTEKGFGGFDGNSLEYPHMLQLDMALHNERYTPETGTMLFDADLFYKNWTSPVPALSFGASGAVTAGIRWTLLQFKEAKVDPFERTGSVSWATNPFDPAPPTNPSSVSKWRRLFQN